MVSQIHSCLARSSPRFYVSGFQPKAYNRATSLSRFSPEFANHRLFTVNRRITACVSNPESESVGEPKLQGGKSEWSILQRWKVPWGWRTVSLTMHACALSSSVAGLIDAKVLPLLGIKAAKRSLEQQAVILFLGQGLTTAIVLAVIFTVAKNYEPLPRDVLRCDLKEPFHPKKGWLVWSGIGLLALTFVVKLLFRTRALKAELGAVMNIFSLLGTSKIITLCVVGTVGILYPLLEETLFRGFFMASLTKWVPTPIAIIISSAVFAIAHLKPAQFPQMFVLGSFCGLSYAQTRNLFTPMVIHGLWNSGLTLQFLFLQINGVGTKALPGGKL